MKLPSVETLAALAAAMASPTEEPGVAAKRALALWSACESELRDKERRDRLCAKARDDERTFLKACGIGGILSLYGMHHDDHVSLDTFLKACKPSTNSKPEDVMGKWRAFRKSHIEQVTHRAGQAPMSEKDILEATDTQMNIDRETGILAIHLLPLREAFSDFLRIDRKAQRSARGKKGGRPPKAKKSEATTKKVVGAKKVAKKSPQVREGRK